MSPTAAAVSKIKPDMKLTEACVIVKHQQQITFIAFYYKAWWMYIQMNL